MMNLSNMDRGGLVLGMSRDRSRLYCNTDDTHTLIIGATRSGKSRNVVLPSICTMALAGESMVVVDPKAELYLYTYPYLERLGYEVVTIDFKEPLKSNRYNFLQPVIDVINMGDNALAVTRARDIATMLVPDRPESHTDPIWINGERSILMASILAVVKGIYMLRLQRAVYTPITLKDNPLIFTYLPRPSSSGNKRCSSRSGITMTFACVDMSLSLMKRPFDMVLLPPDELNSDGYTPI